jgi:uncharacterized membrane protein
MNIQFKKYPIDVIFLMIWSIILLLIILFNMIEIVRIAFGLPFLLFIPGYLLIFILFPKKKEYQGIQALERIGLSLGFSITLVSLVTFLLNYTPWGIRLEPILFSLFLLTEILGAIAIYRWKKTNKDERFIITLQTKSNKKSTTFLSIILVLSMFVASASIIYIITAPVTGQPFTEFYILSQDHNITKYPQDILKDENTTFTLGLINHEYATMNYTIEIWLIDESIVYNESTKENDTIYNHAWFMDKISVELQHTEITNKINQTKKWEYNYTFKINKIGHFKLAFLLFTTPSEQFDIQQDYKNSIDIDARIKSAYRELHLWLYVG